MSYPLIILASAMAMTLATPASAQEPFPNQLRSAMKGDYTAQRNVAFCLRTGDCDGGPGPNRLDGCSWRMIVLASGSREVDSSDIINYQLECVSKLSGAERALVLGRAEKMFRQIYRRQMPLDVILAATRR